MALRAILVLVLAFAVACGRPTGVPESSSGNTQKLPFDGESGSNGISPSQSLIPSATRVPEGTSLTVRLQSTLSSASAHAGDSFTGMLAEAVVDEGQVRIARGATVTGHVLDVRPFSDTRNPGYLRIALVSVEVGRKTVLIDTSSIFVKAKTAPRDEHAGTGVAANQKDVVVTPDRRLTFRLAQSVDLP